VTDWHVSSIVIAVLDRVGLILVVSGFRFVGKRNFSNSRRYPVIILLI
jgi:hypothetical protein